MKEMQDLNKRVSEQENGNATESNGCCQWFPIIEIRDNRRRICIVLALALMCFAICIAMLYVFFLMGTDRRKLFMDPGENAYPLEYLISLKPNMTQFSYTGNVSIQVQCEVVDEAPVSYITSMLSAGVKESYKNITSSLVWAEISSDKNVQGNTYSEIILNKIEFHDDIMTIESKQRLYIGVYAIDFSFTGNISDDMEGIYKSRYVINESEHVLITTQFEAISARRAFPCWDLPSFKAQFSLELVIPSNLTAVSNMPVMKVSSVDGKTKCVKFQKTPLMSTYLLAFTIGSLDYIENTDSSGVVCRVYTTTGKSHLGKFALNTLPFFAEYFHIRYPLPKLDLVAIPDFSFGAMENWGLMTFREAYLLVSDTRPKIKSIQRVALTVSHEIAHQWFGNLVTMRKWTELWLNEGFATWIEYFNVNNLYPEMEIWTQFVMEIMKSGMQTDCLRSTHPIQINVIPTKNIMEVFDAVSYAKGAAVIRMMHEYIGARDFQHGLGQYLKDNMYKNTDTVDLWNALSSASKLKVNSIMSKWTQEPGFPLLTVKQTLEGEDIILHFKQQRFLANGKKDTKGTIWNIFVTVAVDNYFNESTYKFLMSTRKYKFKIRNARNRKWLKVNIGKIGFYVVHYSDILLDALKMNLHFLTELDRFDTQSDLYFLSVSGYRPIVDYLKFIQAFNNETSLLVWKDICENLNDISMIVEYMNDITLYKLFKAFKIQIYSYIVEKLQWDLFDGDSKISILNKVVILKEAGFTGVSEVVERAIKLFESAMNGSLTSELRFVVLSINSFHGSTKTVKKMIEIHRGKTEKLEEKNNILQCIGYTQDPFALWLALEYNFLSGNVRKQDISYMIQAASNSKIGREVTWKFFVTHHEYLSKMFTRDYLMAKFVKKAFNNFASEKDLKEMKAFLISHENGNEYTLKQIFERIAIRSNIARKEKNSLSDYLHDMMNDFSNDSRDFEYEVPPTKSDKATREDNDIEV